MLSSIVCGIVGIISFFSVARHPSVKAPIGPVEIGVGPYPDVSIDNTEVFVYIPESSIDIQVTFKFKKIQEYFIYALLPYSIFNGTSYAIHSTMRYPSPEYDIGNFSTSFLNTAVGSSIINASLDLNPTFPYYHFFGQNLEDELTLSVSINLRDSLIAIHYPLGSKQTIILTFFGDVSGVITEEMYSFKKPSAQITIDQPFIIHLKMPSQTYFSESQPPPIQYYIKEARRWVMFSLDFLEGHYAQTLFCSFGNPTMQAWKEILVFLGGVFVAASSSFGVLIVKHYVEKDETELKISKKKKDPKPESEEPSLQDSVRHLTTSLLIAVFVGIASLLMTLCTGLYLEAAVDAGTINPASIPFDPPFVQSSLIIEAPLAAIVLILTFVNVFMSFRYDLHGQADNIFPTFTFSIVFSGTALCLYRLQYSFNWVIWIATLMFAGIAALSHGFTMGYRRVQTSINNLMNSEKNTNALIKKIELEHESLAAMLRLIAWGSIIFVTAGVAGYYYSPFGNPQESIVGTRLLIALIMTTWAALGVFFGLILSTTKLMEFLRKKLGVLSSRPPKGVKE